MQQPTVLNVVSALLSGLIGLAASTLASAYLPLTGTTFWWAVGACALASYSLMWIIAERRKKPFWRGSIGIESDDSRFNITGRTSIEGFDKGIKAKGSTFKGDELNIKRRRDDASDDEDDEP